MKKKVFLILTGFVVLAGTAFLWFQARINRMYDTFASEEITDIDLTSLQNGVYPGEAGEFVVSVKLTVTVENHTITSIDIIDQNGGSGYEALEILPRMIEAQSPDVDIVTGATGSSRCIMIAVRNALLAGTESE